MPVLKNFGRLISVVSVFTLSVAFADSAAAQASTEEARVVAVVDGDTIKVSIKGRTETVRLIGVDTPETKKPGAPVQCYGPEATAATTKAVAGAQVRLTKDRVAGDRDRWGRLLRYVSVKGQDLGEYLLRSGAARAYAYKNQRYAKRVTYERIQSRARSAKTGMWGSC